MPTARAANGSLTLGGVRLDELARDPRIGTPAYVYDVDGIAAEARALDAAFDSAPHLVAYAVKANSAGPIVRALANAGCGADVVSGAEMRVALGCGISPEKIVFSGVAKTDDEIDQAIGIGERGILALQVESVEELARVERRARSLGRKARVSLRINPSVDKSELDTHAHIATGHDEAKFGVPLADVGAALSLARAASHVELVGLASHVGSQFTSVEPYLAAARVLFGVAREARDARATSLAFVDAGGGFGIGYAGEPVPPPADFVRAARVAQREARLDDLALNVEPGRALVAAHGVLLATVIQSKQTPHDRAAERRWLLLDAGMNDLIRPALYQARHRIVPLEGAPAASSLVAWRVVGPVCESSDDFGAYELPEEPPRAVAILDAGAYGYVMASRYNGRPLPAEVFLEGGRVAAIAPRAPVTAWSDERIAIGR